MMMVIGDWRWVVIGGDGMFASKGARVKTSRVQCAFIQVGPFELGNKEVQSQVKMAQHDDDDDDS
jgi:hypothetical protein